MTLTIPELEIVNSKLDSIMERLDLLLGREHPLRETTASNYMTVAGVSQLTAFAKTTIYRFVCERRIPHIKIGSRLLFSRSDVELWMDAHRVKPVPSSHAGRGSTQNQSLSRRETTGHWRRFIPRGLTQGTPGSG